MKLKSPNVTDPGHSALGPSCVAGIAAVFGRYSLVN
jgi:hypothetical protein